VKEKEEEEERD